MKHLWKWLTLAGVLMVLSAVLVACGSGGGGEDAVSGPGNTDGAPTILIPGGTFMMGSEQGESQAEESEMPLHEVTLAPYYIYHYEVTNAMYARCVAAGACIPVVAMDTGPISAAGDPVYADHPVVGVDWNMARDYCTWANGHLPTEAQWEYAASGKDGFLYPWGSEPPDCERTNMLDCLAPQDDIDTMAIAMHPMGDSPFGVGDMAGNAWEWINDWFDEDYYGFSPTDNPIGPLDGETKGARGGGWNSPAARLRSSSRLGGDPLLPYEDVGFRCVAGPLVLPREYVAPPDSHKIPDEPVDFDDPGDISWIMIGPAVVSCPDANGQLTVFVFAASKDPVTWTVELNGTPFTCGYDDTIKIITCTGPAPANNAQLDFYDVIVKSSAGHQVVLHPTRWKFCDTEEGSSFKAAFSSSCPENGKVLIHVVYNEPMTWDITRADGVDIPCIPTGATAMDCYAPQKPGPQPYLLFLHGKNANGVEQTIVNMVPASTNCPEEESTVKVLPACTDEPIVKVAFHPTDMVLQSVMADGQDIPCIQDGPGVYYCGPLPGQPGDPVAILVTFEDGFSQEFNVAVPDCDKGSASADFECLATGAPVLHIQYSPPDYPIVSAYLDGMPVNILENAPGDYYGFPVTGNPGDEVEIKVCLAGGSGCCGGSGDCFSTTAVIPDCSQEFGRFTYTAEFECYPPDVPMLHIKYSPTNSPLVAAQVGGIGVNCIEYAAGEYICFPIPGYAGDQTDIYFLLQSGDSGTSSGIYPQCGKETGGWILVSAGCQDENQIFFTVYTGLDWIVPGADVIFTANDAQNVYTCMIHPTLPGTAYCYGPRSQNPGSLTFCMQTSSDPQPVCKDFPLFVSLMSNVPPCKSEEPQPTTPCSTWKNPTDCSNAGCAWVTSPLGPGYCK